MMLSCWGSFQGDNSSLMLLSHVQKKNKVTIQITRQMLVHYLLVSTCFVTSVITEEKWKWSDRERARLVNTTCDIQKKKYSFSLAFKTLWMSWVVTLFTQYCEGPLGSTEE